MHTFLDDLTRTKNLIILATVVQFKIITLNWEKNLVSFFLLPLDSTDVPENQPIKSSRSKNAIPKNSLGLKKRKIRKSKGNFYLIVERVAWIRH